MTSSGSSSAPRNKIGYGGYDEEFEIEFGRRRYSFVKSRVFGPLDQVVDGSKLLEVIVR